MKSEAKNPVGHEEAVLINEEFLSRLKEIREKFPTKHDPFPNGSLVLYDWLENLSQGERQEFLVEITEKARLAYEALFELEKTLTSWEDSARLLKKISKSFDSPIT